ncbi:MAG: signal peptidase I [Planctomycetaceae bacterium]|nr:signal peptidase I [Planctomycetaceae bacterium]
MTSFSDPHETSILSGLRITLDRAIVFVIAVMVLRSFVLEGYLISTGSMAPGLLGFHRRIHCPSCGYSFAFGVSFDDSVDSGNGAIIEPSGPRRYATCPNCHQINIDVGGVPNSHGDQLLVLKHAYDLRPPHRWETIVFRNPASPEEAYVKRVVGLPGEEIQVRNGDVFINGDLARKTWDQQLDMRIPVCDLHHLVDSDQWQMPWELDEAWTAEDGDLVCDTSRLKSPSSGSDSQSDISWIRFRYWRWFGGHHVAETPIAKEDCLEDWKRFLDRFSILPISWTGRVRYDDEREVLCCEGVMPDDLQKDLLKQSQNEKFRQAVFRLAALSHLAPVTDRYGYNALVSSPEYVVSDLMLDTTLEWDTSPELLEVRIPVGSATYGLVIDPAASTVILMSLDDRVIISQGKFPEAVNQQSGKMQLQVSNFDRQLTIAVNGTQCFEPLALERDPSSENFVEATVSALSGQPMEPDRAALISLKHEQQRRWAFGVVNGTVRVKQLQMFRDVFYTPGRRKHGVNEGYKIPELCYFVQGDNSPVSSDSRNWTNPCVPHTALIGKPFLVHLPSRPGVIEFGGFRWPLRIPDWGRIRYIR